MSFSFGASKSNRITVAPSVLTNTDPRPISVGFRIKQNTTTARTSTLSQWIYENDSSNGDPRFGVAIQGGATNALSAYINSAYVTSSTWAATTAWHSLCLTCASGSPGALAFYRNGSAIGTGSSSIGTGTTSSFGTIGGLAGGAPPAQSDDAQYVTGFDIDGSLADFVVWNVVLDAAEAQAFTAGVSPWLIRPSAIRAHLPMLASSTQDLYGGARWTQRGTATQSAEHPSIYLPSGLILNVPGAAPVGPPTGTGAATLPALTADATGTTPEPVSWMDRRTGFWGWRLRSAADTGLQPNLDALIERDFFENSGEVTGTAAATLASPTADATGTAGSAGATGTAAATISSPTASASAAHGVAGTGAASLTSPTASATGIFPFTGTGAATITSPTATATGTQGHTGTAAATLTGPTASATGTLGTTGTAAASLTSPTATASGWAAAIGTGAATLGSPTASASGTHTAATVTGTGAATISGPTASALGLAAVLGTANAIIVSPTAAATGAHFDGAITGTGAALLAGLTGAAIGWVPVVGAGAALIASPTASATGARGVGGTVAATLGQTIAATPPVYKRPAMVMRW